MGVSSAISRGRILSPQPLGLLARVVSVRPGVAECWCAPLARAERGGAGGGPGSWQGSATGTWHGTARCCSPSPRSALLIAGGTRVLQKNSSWKESTSPGLPVGWEGSKWWGWCRQEAARRAGGACRGRGYWAGGLLGGGINGMGREASCPWQGGAGSCPRLSGWGWRMLGFEKGVVRSRNYPPGCFCSVVLSSSLWGRVSVP